MEGSSQSISDHSKRTSLMRKQYGDFCYERIGKRKFSQIRFWFGVLFCLSGALIPVGLIFIFRAIRGVNAYQAEFDKEVEFINKAEAAVAFPLMVNSMLRKPGERMAPGLVLICFEPIGESIDFMSRVAMKVLQADEKTCPEADLRELTELISDEDFVRARRRRLPTCVTDNHAVFACDLAIPPLFLPNKHISEEFPFIICLAEPGEAGEIRVVPYWCAFDDVELPAWAASCRLALA